MKFLLILIVCAVFVLISATNRDTKHDYLKERSHRSQIQQEKSHNRVLNRNEQSNRNIIYRDGNENDDNGNADLIGTHLREVIQTIIKTISQFLSIHGIPQLINFIRNNMPDFRNILQTAMKGNITQILSNLNITALPSEIPLFGDIIRQMPSSLENILMDIGHYLNSSSIMDYFNDALGGNLIPGFIWKYIDIFRNWLSEMESGGISGFLGSVAHEFLGLVSGYVGGLETPSEKPTSTDGAQRNGSNYGFGRISNRNTLHGMSNEKKANKLHHDYQGKKKEDGQYGQLHHQ